MQPATGPYCLNIVETAPEAIVAQARQELLQDLPQQFPLLHGTITADELTYNQKKSGKVVVGFYDDVRQGASPYTAYHHIFTYMTQQYCVSSTIDGTLHYTFASKKNKEHPLFFAHFMKAYSCKCAHFGETEKLPDDVRERLITHLKDEITDAQSLKVRSCFMNGTSRFDFTLLVNNQMRFVAIDQADNSLIDFNQRV